MDRVHDFTIKVENKLVTQNCVDCVEDYLKVTISIISPVNDDVKNVNPDVVVEDYASIIKD